MPPRSRLHRLDWILLGGLALAGAGIVWSVWPVSGVDPDYFPRIRYRAYGRRAPGVLIDEAHWNLYTARGRYRPFARLLMQDGYRVLRNKQPFVPGLFRGIDVLVIAHPLGFKGWVERVAASTGLDVRLGLDDAAFEAAEVAAVRDWVHSGGSLLLAAEGGAARSMASAFGVEVTDSPAGDSAMEIVFEAGRRLAVHAITEGRPERGEQVDLVIALSGRSLAGPPGATTLLSYSGKSLALALEFGGGRVVVLSDASALTAQIARRNGRVTRYGINDSRAHNQQFALNILHWLSRGL